MKRWKWQLGQIAQTLGVTGLAGILMLLTAGFLYLGSILPAQQEITRIKHELSSLHSHPQTERHYAPEETLALFYDFFPARPRLNEQLRTIHQLAADKGLAIERVDYRLSHIAGTPLWRYQMSFPLNTDYVTLRHYLADVLQALPNAALEDVDLQRADADAELLEEKIGLVLFLRESGA